MHSKLEVSVIQAKKWSYRVPYVDLIPSHQGEYLEAIECYTKCLRECEKAVIYTNRALCYLKLSKPRDALEDCEKALKIEPSNIKALYRKALANKALQRYSTSLWDLKAVLNLDPSNIATHKEYFTVVDMWKKTTHDHSDTQPSGEEFELCVFLRCTSNQMISKKSVVNRKVLETILDIKLLVEEQHNIPASMQTLEYESHVFDDNTLLRSLGIQSGDTVHVKYSSEADCRAVEEMVVWLFEVVYYLMKECPSIDVGMDRRLESLITQDIITNFTTVKYFEDMLDTSLCDENSVCRLEIAANPSVLQQVLNISTAVPKNEQQMIEVGIEAPQMAAALLLGVSYSVATHKHLANHALIEAIMECSSMERPWCRSDHKQHLLVIRYLSCMLLAQLVLLSLKEIPPSLYQPILSFMEEFLRTPNYIQVALQELNDFVWSTFLPHVRLLYTQDEEIELASALKLCSLEIVLLGLHSMLRRKNDCMVILNEGLVDYIVCLPSYVPETLRSKAQGLIQLLSSEGNVAVHPPRLINLAKAKLAKMYFGLEFVLGTPINEIVNKVLLHNVCD
ncbi:hypothetical protein EMCRGX_G020681 [Ephydatia muelleri]